LAGYIGGNDEFDDGEDGCGSTVQKSCAQKFMFKSLCIQKIMNFKS